jgi:hypothetical protein
MDVLLRIRYVQFAVAVVGVESCVGDEELISTPGAVRARLLASRESTSATAILTQRKADGVPHMAEDKSDRV